MVVFLTAISLIIWNVYDSKINDRSLGSIEIVEEVYSQEPSEEAITEKIEPQEMEPVVEKPLQPEPTEDTEPLIVDPSNIAKKVNALMYHHILRDEENIFGNNGAIISDKSFQEQMKYLYEHKFQTITLDEMEQYVNGTLGLPPKSILITFDDGYKSNYIYAYPILKEYGFKASIFLITSYISDETAPFDPTILQYMSWEEIESSKDVFEFASHTHNLHRQNEEKKGHLISKPGEEVKVDLGKTRELLKTKHFAYPYGHYNEETLEILQELGFTMAYTVKEGSIQPGDVPLELARRAIFRQTTLEQFKRVIGDGSH